MWDMYAVELGASSPISVTPIYCNNYYFQKGNAYVKWSEYTRDIYSYPQNAPKKAVFVPDEKSALIIKKIKSNSNSEGFLVENEMLQRMIDEIDKQRRRQCSGKCEHASCGHLSRKEYGCQQDEKTRPAVDTDDARRAEFVAHGILKEKSGNGQGGSAHQTAKHPGKPDFVQDERGGGIICPLYDLDHPCE